MLYDKFAGFLESMDQIDKGLKAARDSYEKAKRQLHGRGGLIRKTDQLRQMGPKRSLENRSASLISEMDQIKNLGARGVRKKLPSSFHQD